MADIGIPPLHHAAATHMLKLLPVSCELNFRACSVVVDFRRLRAACSFSVVASTFSCTWLRFQCKNGHPYAVGECGGAMRRSTCPECGEVIGGANHELDVGNSVAAGLLELAQMRLGEDP